MRMSILYSFMVFGMHIQCEIHKPCTTRKSRSLIRNALIHEISLRQRQRFRWLSRAHHTIRLDRVRLRIDLHLRPHVVELHILLANLPAIPDSFHALLQPVGLDDARRDRRLRDERDARLRDKRREHGAHDNRLYGRNGSVGIALLSVSKPWVKREEERTICAYAHHPLFTTKLGLTPKFSGFHSTKSATLPTSTLPIK